jgi:Response regulator containing a CheY-like receiver domain and an HTH DNA-binding domain
MDGKESKGSRISVIVVDDHEIVRVGLRTLLAADANIDLVGEASSGREAVALAKELRPEIVLMDLAMPLLNGMEATRQILQYCPTIKIIALSSYNDPEHVEQAVTAGASGYLLKGMAPGNLLGAIYEVHRGKRCFSPAIAERIVEKEMGSGPPAAAGLGAKLSIREAEVLQLIAEGMPNKQIAEELHLSIKTIEKHRHALMGKLDLHSVADLVRYAIARKTIEGECAEESQVDA